METALSTLSYLPSNRKELEKFLVKAKNEILESSDLKKMAVFMKIWEELIKKLRTDRNIQEAILEEVEKEGVKSFEYNGAEFTIKETGTKYDYSVCNDSEWEEAMMKEKEFAEKRKKREKELKVLSKDYAVIDSGEIITPPIKTSKTSVAITLK